MSTSVLKKTDFNASYFPKIPVADVFFNNRVDLLNLEPESKKVLDKAYSAIEDGSKFIEKPIDVKKVYPTQKFLNFFNLKKIEIKNNSTDAELVKVGDKYYILDGHHRIAKEILSGEEIVLAKVYEPEIREHMNIRKIVKKVLIESFISSDGELKDKSLIVLVGPPSIGKTTWIKNNFPDAYIISRDDIVSEVANSFGFSYDDMYKQPPKNSKIGDYHEKYGEVLKAPDGYRFSEKVYSKVIEANNKVYKKMLEKTSGAKPSGKDIVVDMTNMNKFQRKNALKTIQGSEDEYLKIAVEFDFKGHEELIKKVAKKRENELRKKGIHKTIYDYVFDRLFSSYEPVSKGEGFDKIISVNNIENLKKYLESNKEKNVSESLKINVKKVINEIDWEGDFSDVQHTCVDPKEVANYLNRVRANAPKDYKDREKFKRNLPFIHAKSLFFKKEDGYDVVDVEHFIERITEPPNSIITDTNEKIRKTGGINEYVYKTGIPAFRGIVYDKENSTFHYVNTCPGAGSCVLICYALKGNYIRYTAAYDVMTRRLNYLLNHPDKYEEQMYNELKRKAEEHDAYEGYKSKVLIRWNDSGDFFSKLYLKISKNVIKRLKSEGYNVDSYAYTKVADVAKDDEFDATFSTGADKRQMSLIDLKKHKNADIIPKSLSKGLNLMKFSDEEEYKRRVVSHFGLDPKFVITYDEMLETPKGSSPKWYVIVSPGDGDDAAFRKDVKTILLTQH